MMRMLQSSTCKSMPIAVILAIACLGRAVVQVQSLIFVTTHIIHVSSPFSVSRSSSFSLNAKKRRNSSSNSNDNNLFDWYDKIDTDANPNSDDIFWEEMERQKIMTSNSSSSSNDEDESSKVDSVLNGNSQNNMNANGSGNGYDGTSSTVPQNADAILAQFQENMSSDNWIGGYYYGGNVDDNEGRYFVVENFMSYYILFCLLFIFDFVVYLGTNC